ncbi:ParA family protein [Candidatus Poribacteria bacterium]|nr:ParA family protein [Candidatus Poribacteria bacterium]
MEVISIHSNKGGSGKTTLAICLAALFAEEGKQVCIVETDLSGAGLYGNLKLEGNSKNFNQYILKDKISIESLLRQYTDGKINFWAIICSPEPREKDDALREIERKGRSREMINKFINIVERLQELKKPTSFDYCIFDCSPSVDGTSLLSLGVTLYWNGIPVFISTSDRPHIGGTILELIAFFGKAILDPDRTLIVTNFVPEERKNLYESNEKLKETIREDGILRVTNERFTKAIQIPWYDFILENPEIRHQFLLKSPGKISLKSVENTNIPRIAKQIQNKLSKER